MEKTRVLVSNLPLPYSGIGSWTVEINYFLEKNPDYFGAILSPNFLPSSNFVFAQKKKWLPGSRLVRNFALKNWIAKDYIHALRKLASKGKPLQILVIDDLALLEAISFIKEELPTGSELVYYFHGHLLSLKPDLQERVDLVLFLTEAGYSESFSNSYQFIPEVEIVGNGVSTELFYPLSKSSKEDLRTQLGFDPGDKIICWMANSRPVKGIHLFGKMIPKLLAIDPKIKFITIGHDPIMEWRESRVTQLGKLKPEVLAKYLQASDFYFFTSLWKEGFGLSLVEAIKCGNYIFCSDAGGISSVISSISRVSKIKHPNILHHWVDEFERVFKSEECKIENDSQEMLRDFYSLENWENRLKSALD